MRRVVLVHGWGGTPEHGWFPWIKKELETKGFEVVAPQLPVTAEPRKERWVPALSEAVGMVDQDTYFIGHSMGCQTIARYLEKLPESTQVGGVVYVAGFFKRLTNMGGADADEIVDSWLSAPIDLRKIRAVCPKSVALFSDNDQYVPLDNVDTFRDELGSEIIIVPNGDHFSGAKRWSELSVALEALLRLAQK
jgi:uncharacterized protein